METKFYIQMSGPPGAGKSTIAKLLAGAIRADVVDHDLIKSQLLEDAMPFDEASKQTYSLQWTAAEQIMQKGFSVILDSTCNFKETLETGYALAKKYNYRHIYVECRVDDICLLDRRLHQRVPMRSQRRGVDEPALHAACPSGDCRAQYRQCKLTLSQSICSRYNHSNTARIGS